MNMNLKYTQCAINILNKAKYLAEDFRSKYVGTSHVLPCAHHTGRDTYRGTDYPAPEKQML